jgi:hypothetical protein
VTRPTDPKGPCLGAILRTRRLDGLWGAPARVRARPRPTSPVSSGATGSRCIIFEEHDVATSRTRTHDEENLVAPVPVDRGPAPDEHICGASALIPGEAGWRGHPGRAGDPGSRAFSAWHSGTVGSDDTSLVSGTQCLADMPSEKWSRDRKPTGGRSRDERPSVGSTVQDWMPRAPL